MSLCTSGHFLPRRFRLVLHSFLQHDDLAFADVLSETDIQAAFDAHDADFAQAEDDVYTPQVALWAFLSQTLFKAFVCRCRGADCRLDGRAGTTRFQGYRCLLPGAGQVAQCRAATTCHGRGGPLRTLHPQRLVVARTTCLFG